MPTAILRAAAFGIVLLSLLPGCAREPAQSSEVENQAPTVDQELVDELTEMVKMDQIAAYIPQGEYKKLTEEEWKAFKRETFTRNHKRIEQMFREHGFLGFDKVGKAGSNNFWVLTQHCDHAPEFQREVLEQMKVEVTKGNADPSSYAMLIDRVNLNFGEPQVYGTQVAYNPKLCQAYARNLQVTENVNQARKELGLASLEAYLDGMSQSHFEMNRDHYRRQGIEGPTLYLAD